MKVLRISIILCVFASCAALCVNAEAAAGNRESRRGRQERPEGAIRRMYDRLDLTGEQKSRIDENKTLHRQRTKEMMEETRQLRETMRQLLKEQELNMDEIDRIQSRLKAVQSDMLDDRLESVLEVRSILTPEQFDTFIELTEKRVRGPKDRQKQKR